jgi:hypothetical protein
VAGLAVRFKSELVVVVFVVDLAKAIVEFLEAHPRVLLARKEVQNHLLLGLSNLPLLGGAEAQNLLFLGLFVSIGQLRLLGELELQVD